MSGVITSSSFSKLLWPGLNAIYGKAYNDYRLDEKDFILIKKASKKTYKQLIKELKKRKI